MYADDPAPAEASELPISDKPVTLSFKGTLPSSKTGMKDRISSLVVLS